MVRLENCDLDNCFKDLKKRKDMSKGTTRVGQDTEICHKRVTTKGIQIKVESGEGTWGLNS